MPDANSRRVVITIIGLLVLGIAAFAAYRFLPQDALAKVAAASASRADSYAYNDTGVAYCANQTDYTRDCSPAALGELQGLGQDGETGADAAVPGKTAFSFTKIDVQGNPLPDDAPSWNCVRDNTTGLLWEHKTGKGLHSFGIFSWYNPDAATNGGSPGFQNPVDALAAGEQNSLDPSLRICDSSLPACNSREFTNAVNRENYCGRHDWRLPEIDELTDLGNFDGLQYGPHDRFFKDTVDFNVLSRTSLPVTPNEMASDEEARLGYFWTVSGSRHEEQEMAKSELLPIRLVSDLERKPVTRTEDAR
ncbi:MAG: DUF1566 domain-containing protein [Fluviicoccus sp.]|uniref:Lcl domain-containing protein n=1 Tax=Fluviicoccus sp. TaxID=2003552 RepID=UPI002722997E|nr:DUF1566 domain-containing protein [Fluviicoccus sp.]MDO8329638.1 DUF1566 domain-containing protein [Fluviicoccus sp.]